MTPYFNFYFSASEKSELQKRNHKILHPIQLAYIPKTRKIISFTSRFTTPLPINKKYSDYKKLGLYKHFVMLRYRSGYENPTYLRSQIPKRTRHHLEKALNNIRLSQDKLVKFWEEEQRAKHFIDENYPAPPTFGKLRLQRLTIEKFNL